MQEITIKQGDTRNALVATLKKNGQPVNITDCTVLFFMKDKVKGGYCQVLEAENGKVLFPLEETAVNTSGLYKAEFKVIYPDGRKETFPNDDYLTIYVKQGLE